MAHHVLIINTMFLEMRNKISLGFTLVELLVAIAIIATISAVGVASFVSYGSSQTLNTTTLDVVNMLETARSRALTQVKPPVGNCTSIEGDPEPPLVGYQVTINNTNKTYTLDVVCGNAINQESRIEKKLPPGNINFTSSITLRFLLQSAGVVKESQGNFVGLSSGQETITVEDGTITKTITVYSDGRVLHD